MAVQQHSTLTTPEAALVRYIQPVYLVPDPLSTNALFAKLVVSYATKRPIQALVSARIVTLTVVEQLVRNATLVVVGTARLQAQTSAITARKVRD
jgi:hypothetical protein